MRNFPLYCWSLDITSAPGPSPKESKLLNSVTLLTEGCHPALNGTKQGPEGLTVPRMGGPWSSAQPCPWNEEAKAGVST